MRSWWPTARSPMTPTPGAGVAVILPRRPMRQMTAAMAPYLPPNARVIKYARSPRQDQIVWLIRFVECSSYAQFIHRFFPAYPENSTRRQGLWLTDGEGGHPRLLGSVREAAIETGHGDHVSRSRYLWFMEWSPDGKQLGFTYESQLYTPRARLSAGCRKYRVLGVGCRVSETAFDFHDTGTSDTRHPA